MKKYTFILLILISLKSVAQEKKISFIEIPDSIHKKRLYAVTGTYVAAWTGSILALNNVWYAQYPKSKLHSFNDSKEWLQVDKIGHAFSAYELSLIFSSALQWSGVDKKRASIFGALSGVTSLSVIEILDGYSAGWGFSWSDMLANSLGSGIYASQNILWNEQRILFKFSTHAPKYENGQLKNRAKNLYGSSLSELIFKDYNGQTYWLSGNIKSFFPKSNFPKWLNIAVGYGAQNLYGGFENEWSENGIYVNRKDVPRLRQFYLSPDIDLSRIKTRSKIINSIFKTFTIKMPLPTLEINSNGKLCFYPIYF